MVLLSVFTREEGSLSASFGRVQCFGPFVCVVRVFVLPSLLSMMSVFSQRRGVAVCNLSFAGCVSVVFRVFWRQRFQGSRSSTKQRVAQFGFVLAREEGAGRRSAGGGLGGRRPDAGPPHSR